MSSELEEYKNTKITELKNQYNINHTITTNTYNQMFYDIMQLKNRNKQLMLKMMVSRYNLEIQNLKNILNSNIENILKFTPNDKAKVYNNKNGILIGLNYMNTEYELFGSINNSIAIKDKLIKTYNFNNIDLFLDNNDGKLSKEDILENFKNVLINSKKNDLIFIFYSGLSCYCKDKKNVFNLNKCDNILNDEIKILIQTYLKKNVTLFILLDACYDINIMDLKYQYLGDNMKYNTFNENDKNILESNGNIILINGYYSTESNLDINDNLLSGAVTWSFLQTLSTYSNPTWREILVNMYKLIQESEYNIIPQFYTNNILNMDSKIYF